MFKIRINTTRYFEITLSDFKGHLSYMIILGDEHPDQKGHPDEQVSYVLERINDYSKAKKERRYREINKHSYETPRYRGKVGKILNPYGATEFFVMTSSNYKNDKIITVGWIHKVDGVETYTWINSLEFYASRKINYIGIRAVSSEYYGDMSFEILNGRLEFLDTY